MARSASKSRNTPDVEDLIIQAQVKLSVIEGIAELGAAAAGEDLVEGSLSAEHWRGLQWQLQDVRALLDRAMDGLPAGAVGTGEGLPGGADALVN